MNGAAAGGAIYATETVADKVAVFTEGQTPEAPNTDPASGETQTTAVLHGELNPKGAKGALKYQFDYNKGASGTGGQSIPVPAETVAEADEALVKRNCTDLEPNAKYTVCLVAINKFGETLGSPVSFDTTAAAPTIVG